LTKRDHGADNAERVLAHLTPPIDPNMSTPEDRIHGWIDGVLDRSREHLRHELEQLVASVSISVSAEHEEATRTAQTAAEAAAEALVADAVTAERRASDERVRAAVADAQAAGDLEREQALDALRIDHQQSRQAELDRIETRAEEDLASAVAFARTNERHAELAAAAGLLAALEALDQAQSLTELLDALALEVARQVDRSALLVVRGDRLRGWRWTGFAGEAQQFDLALDQDALVANVARGGTAQTESGPRSASMPLTPTHDDSAAVAVPVSLDGRVVAVIYGDDDGDGTRTVPSAWPELLQILARHAGRCAEAMTARRMPELLRASADVRTRQRAAQQADEAAQRCARLLVAEIKLYHEDAVEHARQQGEILRRLRPQIERAEKLYAERVPESIRAVTNYFDQELVRTLAGGDPALLGQGT
jgi:hypothetical protein